MKLWEFVEFKASKLENAGPFFQVSMLVHTRHSVGGGTETPASRTLLSHCQYLYLPAPVPYK